MEEDDQGKSSQLSKRTKTTEDMEEESQNSSNMSSSNTSNPSSNRTTDRDNNNHIDTDEDFIDVESFRKEDITGTLLVFESLPFLTTVDTIGALIQKLGFHLISLPTVNEISRTAYARIAGEGSYEDFKIKYKGDLGKLAAKRMIGTDTIYANLAVTRDVAHFERVKGVLGGQFRDEIVRVLKRREGDMYVNIPEINVEILSMKSAIIHFKSLIDTFSLLRRIVVRDFFFVNDTSLRIIKSLIKSSDDTLTKILATIKPPKGSRKFLEAKEDLLYKISSKVITNKSYNATVGPSIWTQIFKKDGHATNMAIGFINKGKVRIFLDAVKAIYTDNPAKLSGYILTMVEHGDNHYTRV